MHAFIRQKRGQARIAGFVGQVDASFLSLHLSKRPSIACCSRCPIAGCVRVGWCELSNSKVDVHGIADSQLRALGQGKDPKS